MTPLEVRPTIGTDLKSRLHHLLVMYVTSGLVIPGSLKWNSPYPCKHVLEDTKAQHKTVTSNLQNLSDHIWFVHFACVFLILASSDVFYPV